MFHRKKKFSCKTWIFFALLTRVQNYHFARKNPLISPHHNHYNRLAIRLRSQFQYLKLAKNTFFKEILCVQSFKGKGEMSRRKILKFRRFD